MKRPETGLELCTLTVGEWQENCYLVVNNVTKEALLIDPGAEAERILAWVEGVKVSQVLLTHAHHDHIEAVDAVRAALGVRIGLHPGDRELALSHGLAPDFALNDGQHISLGVEIIRIVNVPGHTQGSICLLFGSLAVVGDAIFPGGPGHTNSPQELEQSLASLRRTVFTWPDETQLFPGHGPSTTVGRERPGFEAFLARPRPPELFGDVSW